MISKLIGVRCQFISSPYPSVNSTKWVACGQESEFATGIAIYLLNGIFTATIHNTCAISAPYVVILLILLLLVQNRNYLYSCKQKEPVY
jgi:hypothetical protein